MTAAVALLPFVIAALLGATGARLGRWLPPATATRLLTVTSLVTALATGFVLTMAAFTVLAQAPVLAAHGHWSAAVLHRAAPVPAVAGLLPAAVVGVLLLAAVRRAIAGVRDIAAAERTCRKLGPSPTGLVVVDDDHLNAYTLPGISGRVVISTAMLRALPAEERQVLLAHESSHLRHRHHLYLQLSDIAAAANPLLRPAAIAVARTVERWADEDAATSVGDRRLTARALARAGLARAAAGRAPMPGGALGAVHNAVAERAQALLAPAPKRRRTLSTALAALMLCTAVAALLTENVTEHRFEQAQTAYARTL